MHKTIYCSSFIYQMTENYLDTPMAIIGTGEINYVMKSSWNGAVRNQTKRNNNLYMRQIDGQRQRDWFVLRNWLTQSQRLESPQSAVKGERLETHGRVDETVMILNAGRRQNPFLFEGPQFSHLRLSIDWMGSIHMMKG